MVCLLDNKCIKRTHLSPFLQKMDLLILSVELFGGEIFVAHYLAYLRE